MNNRPINTRVATITVLAGAIALAGCKSKAPDELPVASTQALPQDTGVSQGPMGGQLGTQEHFENAVRGQNVIYFDTDRYNIDSADAAALQTQLQYLMQNAQLNITIEGHTDERGTREYNLALGERRANAAKNYLVGLGMPANRVRTVSYGKERPAALGSDQQSWSQNRRAVSVIVN
ncbi:MAG: peptidoglycan-associated lipoprotein Pal [Pontixanthobacter sp.]